ncbi:MAG: folylpolyglutamate synthase/dihydrofolate synthase family protein [Pseudomonadota bacterium]|nr:folylpolyglutamate synthase/dihydrofolate synthase family protein [Pseudomonadota bacterium]
MDLSLGRIENLLKKLGNPQDSIERIIHVAGTNGKGSTLTYISSILNASGFSVDSYTSPHLVHFNERIKIGKKGYQENINDAALEEILLQCEKVNNGDPITIFELITAAAFLKFSKTKSDFLILETGLGGRLDATNVIQNPLVSVITPIGIDHQQFLGESIQEIASEKAGIIKDKCKTVLSYQDKNISPIFQDIISARNNISKIWNKDYFVIDNGEDFTYSDQKYQMSLPLPNLFGRHQIMNAGTAIATISAIDDISITREAFIDGIENAEWPARLDFLEIGPLHRHVHSDTEIWIDGGHNSHAAIAIADAMRGLDKKGLILIIGMLNTKNCRKFLEPFKNITDAVIAIKIPDNINSHKPEKIVHDAQSLGISAVAEIDLHSALAYTRKYLNDSKRILICGSLYLAGYAIRIHRG